MADSSELLRQLTTTLRLRNLKISVAESCTGGMLASLLTELPGSSDWFERGFVTYSNLAKQEMLGVKPELIQNYGAVSQEVAEAMAFGALSQSTADLAIAITGIAGPAGGTRQKPVGTVWFGWAMADLPVQSSMHCFSKVSRQAVRQFACQVALEGAISLLLGNR
jgi:nicotinamide-nucleotide amidase